MKQTASAPVFQPNNKFEKTARRPGGVPREEALVEAQRQVEALRPDFDVWTDTALKELSRVAQSLKKKTSDPEAIEHLMRNTSYLQDLGTTMGYPLITFVAQNLCDILANVSEITPFKRATIECHIDALHLARQDAYRDLAPDQVSQMTEGLRKILQLSLNQR